MSEPRTITVTVQWREVAPRKSAIQVPEDASHEDIHQEALSHAVRMARAAGATVIDTVSWETAETATRIGMKFGGIA